MIGPSSKKCGQNCLAHPPNMFWSGTAMTKGPFPLRTWKRAFFVSFIDLRLKRAVKIEASAKKKQ